MASMYNMLMDMPLFKGISRDLLSSLLEKTHIEFVNYGVGETIASPGDACQSVMFVVAGRIRKVTALPGGVEVGQTCSPGSVIGADHLFGWHTTFASTYTSLGESSVLRISKEQYIRILQSHDIYLINYLNYLSLPAQRRAYTILTADADVKSWLRQWLAAATDSLGTDVEITGIRRMAEMFRESEDAVRARLQQMADEGTVKITGDKVVVTDRQRLF